MVGEIMFFLSASPVLKRTERPLFVISYIREFGGLSAVFLMVWKADLTF